MITILGSCRQYSIGRNEPTNNILEDLTYPHYSKEVLQAIKYLKFNHILKEKTRLCFRTGILRNNQLEWNHLNNQFKNSDIIVIEIASLKEYIFEDLYLHHITYDSLDYQVSRELQGKIQVRNQTKEELEKDIEEIKELLSDKKIMIVGHLTTRETGNRYMLNQWLKEICSKNSILFIEPNVLLKTYKSEDLYVNEPVLAHYTKFGEEKIYEEVYKTFFKKLRD